MIDADKLALIRSIVISADIDASKDPSPAVTTAIAWRTIGQIRKVLVPNDENKLANLVIPQTKEDI